uniref:Uncharacterized protein n=1 Tax=Schizaphis graminum TaxID=13262 RepID=A0A2S2NC66_SCHGA
MMKIWFNLTISAFVAIVFVVSSVNTNPVSQDLDNQSRPTEPSVKQLSDIHNLLISHISSNISNSTTHTSANTTSETFMFNNNTTVFVEETNKDTTNYTSSEETNMIQSTTLVNVETVIKGQITENVYSTTTSKPDLVYIIDQLSPSHIPGAIIDPKDFTCPDEYTLDTNGNCVTTFPDL